MPVLRISAMVNVALQDRVATETKVFTIWFFMVLSKWDLLLEGKEWIQDILLSQLHFSHLCGVSPSASTWNPQLDLSLHWGSRWSSMLGLVPPSSSLSFPIWAMGSLLFSVNFCWVPSVVPSRWRGLQWLPAYICLALPA